MVNLVECFVLACQLVNVVDVLCASQLMVNVVECFVLACQLVNVVDVVCSSQLTGQCG